MRFSRLRPDAAAAGSGDAETWDRSVWEAMGVLPLLEFINEPRIFPPFDFQNSGGVTTREGSYFWDEGTGGIRHHSWDLGAPMKKIFMLIGSQFSASYHSLFVNSTVTEADGETANNTYLADFDAAGDLSFYRQTAGVYSSGLSKAYDIDTNRNIEAVALEYNGYDAGEAGSGYVRIWQQSDRGCWFPRAKLVDTNHASMRRCGVRMFNSARTLWVAPVVVFGTPL